MKEIHLFVQDGCRPCTYAKTQLFKIPGWEEVVTITNSKDADGEWSEFAEQCGVEVTPTLVALLDGQRVATITGSNHMSRDFWNSVIAKHR